MARDHSGLATVADVRTASGGPIRRERRLSLLSGCRKLAPRPVW